MHKNYNKNNYLLLISELCDCCVKYIEEHYGQIQTEEMIDYITRSKSTMDEVDGLFMG